MSLDSEKKQMIFQAFLASKNKRNPPVPTQPINLPSPTQYQQEQPNLDLITQALRNATLKEPSRKKKSITPSYVQVGEEQQGENNQQEGNSLQRMAALLSQNARLFAENMAELISQKFQERVYNHNK